VIRETIGRGEEKETVEREKTLKTYGKHINLKGKRRETGKGKERHYQE